MRGKHNQQEDFMTLVSLESLVPSDHIVRLMEEHIDFSFIDKRTEGLYSTKGRPSVAPQVLIRMMLIGYLHGITSERRLCQEVHLNLAYRWFCGLSLEDKVPHHSTLSKNRHGRFAGTALFRELFYEIVQQAMDKGLVRGKHLSTDATLIDANAAMRSLEPIVVHCGKEAYWQQLDEERCNEPEEQQTDNLIIDVEVTSPSLTDECLSSVEIASFALDAILRILVQTARMLVVKYSLDLWKLGLMLILPNRRMCLAQKCLNTAKITLNTMKAMTS